MKTIKLSIPLLIGDKHHEKGEVVLAVDSVADSLIRTGGAEVSDGTEAANVEANKFKDAVDPLVPNANPLHDADLHGFVTDEHVGLVAYENATKPAGNRRAAKLVSKPD